MAFEYLFRFHKEQVKPSRAFPLRHSILRPMVRLRMIHNNKHVDVIALIDSGADNILFDADFGEAIGLEVENGYAEKTMGVGGQLADVYFHDVELEIRNKKWKARVGFVKNLSIGALAGREGFFSKFKVCLDQAKAVTTLTE